MSGFASVGMTTKELFFKGAGTSEVPDLAEAPETPGQVQCGTCGRSLVGSAVKGAYLLPVRDGELSDASDIA